MKSRLSTKSKPKVVSKEQKREEFFSESKFDSSKQRYGLFSFTGTLAISKRGFDQNVPNRRGADGSVQLAPRNLTASPTKSGKTPDVFFSPTGYLATGEPYAGPSKPQKKEYESAKSFRNLHGSPFKAAGPSRVFSNIEYQPQGEKVKTMRKDPDGGVYFGPRNFYTSPCKKGNPNITPNSALGEIPEYKNNPYQDPLPFQRLTKSNPKLHERAFVGMSKGGGVFSVYESDTKETARVKSVRTIRKSAFPHDRPFFPTNNTKTSKEESSFSAFPTHMPDPPPKVERKEPNPAAPFKIAAVKNTSPTPSIASMLPNIKSDYPKIRFH